jgi:hypothetical protein
MENEIVEFMKFVKKRNKPKKKSLCDMDTDGGGRWTVMQRRGGFDDQSRFVDYVWFFVTNEQTKYVLNLSCYMTTLTDRDSLSYNRGIRFRIRRNYLTATGVFGITA